MIVKFKKKRLIINLILGIVWFLLGLISVFTEENIRWSNYLYLITGALYTAHFLYDYYNQYLKIEDNIITVNKLYSWKNKIKLDEIISIKKFAGDYTLISKANKVVINNTLVDADSLNELLLVLSKLDLPADKTPFNKEEAAA